MLSSPNQLHTIASEKFSILKTKKERILSQGENRQGQVALIGYKHIIKFISFIDIPIFNKRNYSLQCRRKPSQLMLVPMSSRTQKSIKKNNLRLHMISCQNQIRTPQHHNFRKEDIPGIYGFTRVTKNEKVLFSLPPGHRCIILHLYNNWL